MQTARRQFVSFKTQFQAEAGVILQFKLLSNLIILMLMSILKYCKNLLRKICTS